MSCELAVALLRALLTGCERAQAMMPWGTFAPVALPSDDTEWDALLRAHMVGGPADVLFSPLDKPGRVVHVDRVQFAALTPRADGRCSWLAFDLDGASHGVGGLLDPDAVARCVGERCHELGLGDGLLVVRSRSGAGVHVWLLLGEPVPQADAALVAAYVVTCARRVADCDAEDSGGPHAFATADGGIASPGRAGTVEILPRSTERPRLGYGLVLPFGAVAAERGGSVQLDVFGDRELRSVPRCDPARFARVLAEARRELAMRQKPRIAVHRPRHYRPERRLDPRTEALLSSATPVGERNRALYYAVADLLRAGRTEAEAERELLDAAQCVGLSIAEAQATVASGIKRARARV